MEELLDSWPIIVIGVGLILFLIGLGMVVSVFMSANSTSETLLGGLILGGGGFGLMAFGAKHRD